MRWPSTHRRSASSIGKYNRVDADHGGMIHLIDDINEYRGITREPTWNALMKYSAEIRQRGIKAAFFSSTPQGGGVALMRHALVRLFDLLGVDVKWCVLLCTNERGFPTQ